MTVTTAPPPPPPLPEAIFVEDYAQILFQARIANGFDPDQDSIATAAEIRARIAQTTPPAEVDAKVALLLQAVDFDQDSDWGPNDDNARFVLYDTDFDNILVGDERLHLIAILDLLATL